MKLPELFKNFSNKKNLINQPFIIAEAGVNHEGNLNLAFRLIEEAFQGGADAIKFQTYKAETIASRNSPPYWDLKKEPTSSQYQLFKKYDKFWKSEFEQLKNYCDKIGIEFLSTPFDIESAKFLNDLMNVFKISSSDITNKPFIEQICSFEKPIILSTGASNLEEIRLAVDWIDKTDIQVALLHCVLNYPTSDFNANLGMIKSLQEHFPDKLIGYSDHTLPKKMEVLQIAVLLGASIIEKHFTHDKTLPGNDHYHSMNKDDLIKFKDKIKTMFSIIGDTKKYSLSTEQVARKNARRSLVANKKIIKGSKIKKEYLTWKRPANGISPKDIDEVIGRIARSNIDEDEVIKWSDLE